MAHYYYSSIAVATVHTVLLLTYAIACLGDDIDDIDAIVNTLSDDGHRVAVHGRI